MIRRHFTRERLVRGLDLAVDLLAVMAIVAVLGGIWDPDWVWAQLAGSAVFLAFVTLRLASGLERRQQAREILRRPRQVQRDEEGE